MSEVPKFSQDGGKVGCRDDELAEISASGESHFTLGKPTQRSSEDFEVGEIISFTKMGEIGMLNMESCSARCLSRTVLFFYYNHCIVTFPDLSMTMVFTKHNKQLLQSATTFLSKKSEGLKWRPSQTSTRLLINSI